MRFRPEKKKKNYTFHSYGTHLSFNPERIIEDDRFINEANEFERVRMIDFYKKEVEIANCPHVYILDDRGSEI